MGEQINFLQKSAKEYDNGDFTEAKRMSVALRIMLYDRKKSNSISLLTHLNRKNILFYDTSFDCPPGGVSIADFGLVMHKIEAIPGNGTKITIDPYLDKNPPNFILPPNGGPPIIYEKDKIPFDKWWDQVIINNMDGKTYTRGELISDVCNQEGGAHVDAKLKEDYVTLMEEHHFKPDGPEGGEVISDIFSANIRQIAYEVLKSLKDEFPEYFNE